MFAAGVCEQRKFRFGHAFPEFSEAAIVAIDVVAVGKDFHDGRAAGKTAVEFFESIGSGRMDGDGRDKFGMFLREIEDVIVGDVVGTDVFHFLPVVVVNLVLSQDDNCAEGRGADLVEQSLDVKIFKIALKCAGREADVLQHHRRHGPVPVPDVQPAAAVAGAIADNMDVHVDGFERGG